MPKRMIRYALWSIGLSSLLFGTSACSDFGDEQEQTGVEEDAPPIVDVDKATGYLISNFVAVVPAESDLLARGDCAEIRLLTPEEFSAEHGTPVGPGAEFIINCAPEERIDSVVKVDAKNDVRFRALWSDLETIEVFSPDGHPVALDTLYLADMNFYDLHTSSKDRLDEERVYAELGYLAWSLIQEASSPGLEEGDSPKVLIDVDSNPRMSVAISGRCRTRRGQRWCAPSSASAVLNNPGRGSRCNTAAKNQTKALGRSADQCGHILGVQLGGLGFAGNVFPQNAGQNNGSYKARENLHANLVRLGCDLRLNWDFRYGRGAARPYRYSMRYTVLRSSSRCYQPRGVTDNRVWNQ